MKSSNISLNFNVESLKESATLKINQLVQQSRKRGEIVYHFGFGQSPFPVPERIVNELCKNAHQKDYLTTKGLLELRTSIASYYKTKFNYDFDVENILVGPGSKELIFQLLYVLEGPVIIPAPSWVSYGPQVSIKGKPFYAVRTRRENNYKLTGDELSLFCQQFKKEEQKILIINSPNNPTGQVYSDVEIQDLVRVCREHNIVVISDEIYGMIDFTGVKKKGFCHFYPEGTVVSAGLSKAHSAGGYRLGFMAFPKEFSQLVQVMCTFVSETFSAVSSPIQYAGVAAYSLHSDVESFIDQCNKIHKCVGEYIYDRLNEMNIYCPKPEGAFYVFPDFSCYREDLLNKFQVSDSLGLANLMFQKAQVAILPGVDFYMPKDSLTARMATVDYPGDIVLKESYGTSLDKSFVERFCPNIAKGLRSMSEFLSSLR